MKWPKGKVDVSGHGFWDMPKRKQKKFNRKYRLRIDSLFADRRFKELQGRANYLERRLYGMQSAYETLLNEYAKLQQLADQHQALLEQHAELLKRGSGRTS